MNLKFTILESLLLRAIKDVNFIKLMVLVRSKIIDWFIFFINWWFSVFWVVARDTGMNMYPVLMQFFGASYSTECHHMHVGEGNKLWLTDIIYIGWCTWQSKHH